MFRASQIYGRDRPTPAATTPSSAGKGSWGATKGSSKGAWKDWDDQRYRDQYRNEVSAWGTDLSWNESSWQDSGWASSPAESSSWTASAKYQQAPRQQGGASWRPAGKGAAVHSGAAKRSPGLTPRVEVASISQPMPGTTLNTITLHGTGLSAVGEQAISDACQKVAIDGGFSVHEQITVPYPSSAHVEFPHHSAAAEFLQATGGKLTVGDKVFQVRHPRGIAQETTVKLQHEVQARRGETPTDTLVVRGIGDMTAAQLGEAFGHLTPRLKKVKVHKDYAGQTKGLGWVIFDEIEEADLVLQRLKREGCMLAGRRVSVEFQEPSTIEGIIDLEARKEKSKAVLEASHTQALNGPNSDMWANYLALFQQPQEEPNSKRAKMEADTAIKPEADAENTADSPGWLGLT